MAKNATTPPAVDHKIGVEFTPIEYTAEIDTVFCHDPVNIPTVANEKTVSSNKYKGIIMLQDTNGHVHYVVGKFKGMIPSSMIKNTLEK